MGFESISIPHHTISDNTETKVCTEKKNKLQLPRGRVSPRLPPWRIISNRNWNIAKIYKRIPRARDESKIPHLSRRVMHGVCARPARRILINAAVKSCLIRQYAYVCVCVLALCRGNQLRHAAMFFGVFSLRRGLRVDIIDDAARDSAEWPKYAAIWKKKCLDGWRNFSLGDVEKRKNIWYNATLTWFIGEKRLSNGFVHCFGNSFLLYNTLDCSFVNVNPLES